MPAVEHLCQTFGSAVRSVEMAVGRVVLLVIVVAVSQAECAIIGKPAPVSNNHVDIPDSPANLDVPKGDFQENSDIDSSGNQVKLKQDDTEDPPDGNALNPSADVVLTNSHTITSQDFAAKTGVVGPQESDVADSGHAPASESPMPKIKNGEQLNPLPEKPVSSQDESETPIDSQITDSSLVTSDAIKNEEKPNMESSDGQSTEEVKPSSGEATNNESPSHIDDYMSDLSFYEMSQKISEEIKGYSNDVAIDWEKKKGGASWTLEAESVLKDYMDKISIAQSANKSDCVKIDLENHASRSKALQNVIESCRSNLKQEEWHKLQDTTKQTLNHITEYVQEASASVGDLSTDDPNYLEMKAEVESKAKQRLQEFNSNDLRSTFLKLKEKTIKENEDEYTSCINNSPEQGMIVDTYNDMMRMKNNCVG